MSKLALLNLLIVVLIIAHTTYGESLPVAQNPDSALHILDYASPASKIHGKIQNYHTESQKRECDSPHRFHEFPSFPEIPESRVGADCSSSKPLRSFLLHPNVPGVRVQRLRLPRNIDNLAPAITQNPIAPHRNNHSFPVGLPMSGLLKATSAASRSMGCPLAASDNHAIAAL